MGNHARKKAEMAMMDGWKERLLDAVARDGRSDRAISLAAGLGPNFVNHLRQNETEPGIKKVLRLADELNVSLSTLFLGKDTSPEDEEFLKYLQSTTADERDALLALIRARHPRD